MRPHRQQPTRLPRPWDSPGKNTGVVAISFSNAWKWKVKVKSLSCIRLFATPWTAAYQAPPPMGFSRQEYWSGVPLPSGPQRGTPSGVLLCRSAHQSLKGAPWVGFCSVDQYIRHLMGQPLYCSAADAGMWGERGAMVMAPPTMHDSAVSPCFRDFLAFLHRHFPRQSPPSHPVDLSLCSQQQPSPWDCSTIPKLQLPAAAPSRGPCPGYAWLRQGLILIPFRLPQISYFTLSLKCFSSDSDNCPDVGMGPLLQFPHPPRAGPAVLTTPGFPSSSLLPLSYVWFYIFFPTGQVLLSTLSCCSACTSVSEGVFLMYSWREMNSTSTYSSVILFSPRNFYL